MEILNHIVKQKLTQFKACNEQKDKNVVLVNSIYYYHS